MKIEAFDSGLLHSNMYVVSDNGHSLVIDPCRDLSQCGNYLTDFILVTHEHYDHISGINLWREKTGAPVIASERCDSAMRSVKDNLARVFPLFCEMQTWIKLDEIPASDRKYTSYADITFDGEYSMDWQGHSLRFVPVPGHSAGSTGIFLDSNYFFSGDSLIENAEIELRLPGGSRDEWNSTGRAVIEFLPCGITVFPGHFSSFTYEKNGQKGI